MNIHLKPKRVNYPHFTIPLLNCCVEVDKHGVRKNYISDYVRLPYNCSLPIPFSDPAELSEKHLCGVDCATKLVNDKHLWELGRDELIAKCLRYKGHHVLKTKFKNVKKVLPGTLKLAEHLQLDPDPYFSGFYNWYFSDGSLNALFHSNVNSLLYSSNRVLGTCVVTPVHFNERECVPIKRRSVFLRTNFKQPVLQINVNDGFIAVRQRNHTTLFAITNDEELEFKKIHKHSENTRSIVSTSICDDLDGEYCSLTTSHTLKIWSPEVKNECINRAKIKTSCRNKSTCDHWGSVKYVSNNNILVSTRSSVYLKDTRIELNKNAQAWRTNINKISCDHISLLMRGCLQSAFVGTTHYLYELDFRKGISKQWAHMMEYPPMYGVVRPFENTIFIGSQNVNEICLIDSNSQVMPYILPSPSETLLQVNSQGLCLDQTASVRFKFSMTGITALPETNKSAFIFRITSLGDIFYQKVAPKEDPSGLENNCDINSKLIEKWEIECAKTVYVPDNTLLKITDVVDYERLYNCINGGNLNQLNKISKRCKPKLSKNMKRSCKIPKVKINSKDEFTQSLLSVWNVENMEETQSDMDETRFLGSETVQPQLPHGMTCDTPCRKSNQTRRDVATEEITTSVTNATALPNISTVTTMELDNVVGNLRSPHQNKSANTDTQNRHNANMLNFEDVTEVNDDLYNNTISPLRKGIEKTVVAKSKSRFSSGF